MAVLRIIWIVLAVLLVADATVRAEAPEYQVKAAMLANFALFVEWPPTAFSTPTSPFVVCVLGTDPFGQWLKNELGRQIGTRTVEIRNLQTAETATGCNMIFIAKSEQPRLKEVIGKLQNVTALIVSDVTDLKNFCRQGGMIGLVMEGSKVRFELNAKAAAKAGLKIDSRLKQLARSTECGEGQ